MTFFMGIDIGSAYSKGAIIRDSELVASHVIKSGSNYQTSAEAIRTELLRQVNLTQKDAITAVATGCGADNVIFAAQQANELVCNARGINNIFRQARTVIDVGSQSTRVIELAQEGNMTNFAISEKCAAGGGRFIEVIANILRTDLSEFSRLAATSKNPITFNTGCAVFGESEVITRISEGVRKEDIAAGVNRALASKISSLARKLKLEEPCAICGGGALNASLVKAIESELNTHLLVPPHPELIAALGAAIIAATSAASMSGKEQKPPGTSSSSAFRL